MSSLVEPTVDTGALPEHLPHDPTLVNTTEVRFTSSHEAIGLSMRVETNDDRILHAAQQSFGPETAPVECPFVRLQIFTHHVREAPDWRPRQPVVRRYGNLATIVSSRATAVTVDIAHGVAMGYISEDAASHPDFLRAAIVQSSLLQVAQDHSLAAIHTACLWRDGRTLIVRGLSGAGKSTLCYAALRRGWSLVAEDVVFVRTRPGADLTRLRAADIEAHGLPYVLHLLPDARILFPELADEPSFERPDGDIKLGIDVARRFPGQARGVAGVGPLVFVSRGLTPSPQFSELPRDEALRLLRETVILDEEQVAARTGMWDAFLEYTPYLLETGDDPNASAALLDAVL